MPKATITSVAATGIASVATIGRWQRESRADPESFTFEHEGVTAPLHEHMRLAGRVSFARFISGERPPSMPLRHRMPIIFADPDYDDTDPTPDAVVAPDPVGRGGHLTADDAPAVAPVSQAAPVETAMQRDLRERVEARKRGETMPPVVPVHGAAPPSRYISPEEKSEGVGPGRIREGGFKVQ